MNVLKIIFLLSSLYLNSQINCIEKTEEVYLKIIESIGNKFPPPPTLSFSSSERSVAFISGSEIIIENKIIQELCGKKNFKDHISYIIAHELAHHYLNHNWMRNTGLSYASTIGDFVGDQADLKSQRKLAETQADLYAGFFGQAAGYNTLGYAKETLKLVYDRYKLKNEIPGYPTFDERLEIIESKIKEAESLHVLFEAGNAFLYLGEYFLSQNCYLDIINNNFGSREIYNNLGLVYLLKAISIDETLNKYKFPVHIDLETRANTKKTRSGLSTDYSTLITQAENFFNISAQLDPNYQNVIKNQIVLEFLKQLKMGKKDITDQPFFSKINNYQKTDLKVIEMLIKGHKTKKIQKIAAGGSSITAQNLNPQLIIEAPNEKEAIKYLGLLEDQFFFGFRGSQRLKTSRGSLTVKKYSSNETTVLSIQDVFLVKTNKQLDKFKLKLAKLNGSQYFIKK